MKTAAIQLALLCSLFYIASHVSTWPTAKTATPKVVAESQLDDWRRTARGWELRSTWQAPPAPSTAASWPISAVHPALWAGIQLSMGIAALAIWPVTPPARGVSGSPH